MEENNQVLIEREVPCVMRDGVTLFSTIYRPVVEGTFPVLLTRLPYNKNLPDFSHRYIDPIRLALNGFVVIIQDVRGRFASEGVFIPFEQESEDGYDAVEWAAQLAYSNGKVGMFGLSYYGFTQLYAALEHPPALQAIFPAMTGNVLQKGLFERNGIPELAAAQTWVLDSIAYDYLCKNGQYDAQSLMKEIVYHLNRIDQSHEERPYQDWSPLKKIPELKSFYDQYVMRPFGEELFQRAIEKVHKKGQLSLPAYHLAGWYDSHLSPTLLNYEQMQSAQNNQKLIVGPWSHGYFDSDIGERAFGAYASGHAIDGKEDVTSLHIKWFIHWLKEDAISIEEDDAPVKLFVMGINKWRSEQEWPLERTNYTPYYFGSDGTANSSMTSGRLAIAPSKKIGKDEYIHNPEMPVPSHGGGTLFYKGRNAGPRDQREIEKREDVVIYTSAPMTERVEVTGWVKVQLWVSSDVVSTDFTAKLVDVFPDGRAYNLTDGIVRVKMRDSVGEVVQCEIDLWATSNVFLEGHAIRIEIASSNFPRFDVNPNTGYSTKDTKEIIQANQVIYHGEKYPSHVLLPIIPNA